MAKTNTMNSLVNFIVRKINDHNLYMLITRTKTKYATLCIKFH